MARGGGAPIFFALAVGAPGHGAIAVAVRDYGLWCGACIALSGFMTMLVALPYADAWLRRRKPGARHVG